jgi:hypothetical protein
MDLPPDFGVNRENQMRSQQLAPNMLYAVIQGFIVLPKKNPIIIEE